MAALLRMLPHPYGARKWRLRADHSGAEWSSKQIAGWRDKEGPGDRRRPRSTILKLEQNHSISCFGRAAFPVLRRATIARRIGCQCVVAWFSMRAARRLWEVEGAPAFNSSTQD